jgi:hypothetical protein
MPGAAGIAVASALRWDKWRQALRRGSDMRVQMAVVTLVLGLATTAWAQANAENRLDQER